MAESKYEKYIVRKPFRPDRGPDFKWSNVDNARTEPPYLMLDRGKPIDGVPHMVEYMWIWKDNAMGSTPEGPPHKHDCDEIFLFIGTNKDDAEDLGADIEFWLGEGDEADKVTFSTSALVYAPGKVSHMPIVFKNVKRPLLMIVVAPEAGDFSGQVNCPMIDI